MFGHDRVPLVYYNTIYNYSILCVQLSIYNLLQIERCKHMKSEPLKIKRRGEDGSKVISLRIREDTLARLDALSAETNYSRNELINMILRHGIENIEIE